ncbi:MAG: glucose-6-phosphate isomerase [Proteobacteria bacterium]|nr:glucose-6-phosphate isomerase [Pseudomonadota bacterium]
MNTLTTSREWLALQAHREEIQSAHLRRLFADDPARAARFSVEAAGVFLDYSKNRVTTATMEALMALARARGLEEARDEMFSGAPVNITEHRAVLHRALRARSDETILVGGENVVPGVRNVLDQMRRFTDRVRGGSWKGYRGQPITDIVNIGIGGSDLGPQMVCEALRPIGHQRLSMHFVSNVDGAPLADVLNRVNPETTLFVVVSKTFTTQETLRNATSARSWFLENGGEQEDIARHFVAVSTDARRVAEFGIDPEHMFGFWDWVGGRYSLWSAVGLSIALYIGMPAFAALLDGAREMDEHFASAPLERSMPVILGMLGVWYRQFFNAGSHCIAPYAHRLNRFPAYLQQLDMESNGKSVTRDGRPVSGATGPVIWGEVGTNGQHAFFQLLHQGTDVVPVDFIAPLKADHALDDHQLLLLANCLAQSEALMRGKTADEVRAELSAAGMAGDELEELVSHKVFPGNRPSNTLLLPDLSPHSLGALIALYEHKVFVQGVIWNINSFDQWGVELGKRLAVDIVAELRGDGLGTHDASTRELIGRVRASLKA